MCVPVDVVLGGRRDEDDGVGVHAVLPQRLLLRGGDGGRGRGGHCTAGDSCRHGAPAHTGSGRGGRDSMGIIQWISDTRTLDYFLLELRDTVQSA